MTTRRSFLHPSVGARATTSAAVVLPQSSRGETFQIQGNSLKIRDDAGLFVNDTGGPGHAVVMTRDPQAFLAS